MQCVFLFIGNTPGTADIKSRLVRNIVTTFTTLTDWNNQFSHSVPMDRVPDLDLRTRSESDIQSHVPFPSL